MLFYESLDLSRLIGAEIHEREVNGMNKKCISIPIEDNSMVITDRNHVIMRLFMYDFRYQHEGWTHYISVYSKDPDFWPNIEKLGYTMNLKFLGRARIGFDNRHIKRSKRIDLSDAMNID